MTETEPLRAAMIEAAERQLASSSDHEIATRAVCEAVGVSQPVLYRLFGDKRGLLDAVADHGYERYAALKAAQERTGDPVADLHAGWDGHMAFAQANPALYQLMFTPRPWSHSTARDRVTDLLAAALTRCAAAGALKLEPRTAARLILAANIGTALDHIARPALFADPALSHRMRDAVFSHVLTEPPARQDADPLRAAALRLRAQLQLGGTEALEPVETALLQRWLERIARP
ncbi:TetR family transcriptional regulator [Planomonospora parontospora subsp. parontospora]|uniref:TetR family transcriptional regulator n=2 Tax=Planomonospora parontospora TaxID=58119 RepID=A0AA37BJD7_9ACTN|nr:TetR/AcrR family transcriptional regulator [Planomonospora parontospora]GGK77637.1 TetR family transcriptional regulator [Planomonospora parontospora]GII09967.1 TetR family transcriptional regulator [Planomonospora parontospora subsp. parontospora]